MCELSRISGGPFIFHEGLHWVMSALPVSCRQAIGRPPLRMTCPFPNKFVETNRMCLSQIPCKLTISQICIVLPDPSESKWFHWWEPVQVEDGTRECYLTGPGPHPPNGVLGWPQNDYRLFQLFGEFIFPAAQFCSIPIFGPPVDDEIG